LRFAVAGKPVLLAGSARFGTAGAVVHSPAPST
jgi:hypothetical protein